MDIFHTIVIKISSVITAVLIMAGFGATNDVTIVDVQENGSVVVTATTTPIIKIEMPKATSTPVVDPVTSEIPPQDPQPVIVPEVVADYKQPTQTITVPVYIIKSSPATALEPTPQAKAEVTPTQPMQSATIEIKSPISGKGLGRELKWRVDSMDELNKVYIGAILRNPDGSFNITDKVQVTTSDDTQHELIDGTGTISNFGNPNTPTPYYPFTYYIKTPGKHTVTFTAEGLAVSATVTITVDEEDTREIIK
jgi:hypothetical protein